MDWTTTTSGYPEEPARQLSLDPQLICYSWMTGIPEVDDTAQNLMTLCIDCHRTEHELQR